MSAEQNLDADAFMRKYLERPSDTTARLVFADWLEETGEPHNAAWAHFIRLKAEADRYPRDSATRHELDRQADEYAAKIRARLTIPASLFVGYPKSLLKLLPAENITVKLAGFVIPRSALEMVPPSVAHEMLMIPIDVQERALLLAAANPYDYDTVQKLQYILNRDVVSVGAGREDVQAVIDREYGESEYVDSSIIEFVDTAIDFADTADVPVVRLVNLLLGEAVNLGATRVLLYPDLDAIGVRYRIAGEWVDRDRMPAHLLQPITARLATMAAISDALTEPSATEQAVGHFSFQITWHRHYRVRVVIQPSPNGPTSQLDFTLVHT